MIKSTKVQVKVLMHKTSQRGTTCMFDPREPIDELTAIINGCAFKVQNVLGCGFLEKVYENALRWELTQAGMKVQQQVAYTVRYGPIVAGEYVADLVVADKVIVEVKSCERLSPIHKAQVINYLKISGLSAGLLINFGQPRVEIRRLFRR